MASGSIVEQCDYGNSCCDNLGLGHWSYMRFVGDNDCSTIVLCGYNPCSNNRKELSISYQQQCRYLIQQEKSLACPRRWFWEDLMSLLKKWQSEGHELVICLNANENIFSKKLGKAMTDPEGLNLTEVVRIFADRPLGATYFRGCHPIDGVWASSGLSVVNASVMLVGFGVGCHHLFFIDFTVSSMIGTNPKRIIRSMARRLNTMIEGCMERYVRTLKHNIVCHELIPARKLRRSAQAQAFLDAMNRIDDELKESMQHVEKCCCKLHNGCIPFSSEAAQWIRRTQVYRLLLHMHARWCCNRENPMRKARQCRGH